MGCVCCKPSAIEDSKESPRASRKTSSDLLVSREALSRREEAHWTKDRYRHTNDRRVMLIDKQTNGSVGLHADSFDGNRERMEQSVTQHPAIGIISKASEREQVAAGWPLWLAAVAGEAIKGWLPRRADSFEKLDKVCFLPYFNCTSPGFHILHV